MSAIAAAVITEARWKSLALRAEAARDRAHAPYSHYRVGAALLARKPGEGAPRLFLGANVENASYGLTVCAERNAVMAAVQEGFTELVAIAVSTEGPAIGSPCGTCRQVMAEFAVDLPVAMVLGGVVKRTVTLEALLPFAFRGIVLEQSAKSQRARAQRARAGKKKPTK